MGIVKFLLPSFVLLAGTASAFAQATPSALPTEKPATFDGKRNPKEDKSRIRDLSGFVRDDSGSPIDGAIVRIRDTKSGRTIDYITKQDGSYAFRELDMDIDYELSAKRDGYGDPVKKKLSKYDSRKPAVLNFELAKTKKSS